MHAAARAAALAGLLGALPHAAAAAQQAVAPLAIEDAVGAVELHGQDELGTISPDGALFAYIACDPRRAGGDSLGLGAATVNSAFRSAGCDLRVTALGDGATRTIAASARGGHWGPSWSPDGRRLACYSDRDGVARVWLWDRGSGRLRRVSEVEVRSTFAIDRPAWLPDGRSLLVKAFTRGVPHSAIGAGGVQRMAPPPDTVPGSTVILYRSTPPATDTSAAPATAAPLERRYEDFALLEVGSGRVRRIRTGVWSLWHRLSPDARRLAYLEPVPSTRSPGLGPRYELRSIDLATGAERTLARDIDQEWAGAITWAPDGRHLAYVSRPLPSEARSSGRVITSPIAAGATGDSDLYVVAADGGEPRRFGGAPGPVFRSAFLGPLWTAGSDGLVVVGARKLWRADLATGTIAEVPASVPVDAIVRAADRRTYWSPDGGRSLYVLTTDSLTLASGYAAVDLVTGATRVLLREQRRFGGVFEPPVVTPRGDAVVYVSESASASPNLWRAGLDFQAPRRLTALEPKLDRYAFGEARLVEYRSHDGTPLRGALLLPAGYEPGTRHPLVVWVYASDMGSRNLNRFGLVGYAAYNLHMLTTRGYAVLWPDIPVGVGTPMRDLMKSVMPAIDRVVELGIAHPERLAVMGQSNGGYSTLALLVQTTRFKAAVMNAGFGDLVGFYGSMNASDGSGGWQPWLERMGGAMGVPPWEAPLRYVENSPIFYLDRVETPLVIQAGGKDVSIVQYSDQVFSGLKRLGKDATYLRYEGESHVLAQYPNLVDYWRRVIAFLDERLKARAETASAD